MNNSGFRPPNSKLLTPNSKLLTPHSKLQTSSLPDEQYDDLQRQVEEYDLRIGILGDKSL